MLQPSEVVDLVIAMVLLPLIISSSRSVREPIRRLILVAFGSILFGYTVTILEGFFWERVLNTLEHAAYAAAGVFTLLAILSYLRRVVVPRGDAR